VPKTSPVQVAATRSVIVAYYQRFVDTDGEVCQGREEKQLVEVFTRWNDEGEL
jgi:hypothetical protein